MSRPARSLGDALRERLRWDALAYHVPAEANGLPYVLGGLALVSFALLLATGLALARYYHPMPDAAWQSVSEMARSGRASFVRGVHFWAAQAMVLAVLLHLLRVAWWGSYRRPREANWLVGVSLLFLTVGVYFTGTVLRADQEAVEALAHNGAIADFLASLGLWFSAAPVDRVPLLLRTFVSHISMLPFLIVLLLVAHFFLVRVHGLAVAARPQGKEVPPRVRDEAGPASTFLVHLGVLAAYGLLLAGALVLLAALRPAPLGPPGVEGIEVTKPPWVFLPLYALENRLGIAALFWVPMLVLAFLVLFPFLDRSPTDDPRRRWPVLLPLAVVTAGAVLLGVLAALAPGVAHIG